MVLSRRDLLKRSALTAPAFALAPNLMMRVAFGSSVGNRNLVLIELDGGNDGINTVVPYGLDAGVYYTIFRPTIGIAENLLLKINSTIGLNPGLALLKAHYDAGRLAIVQGVSYPKPNFSHDVAGAIYDTGNTTNPWGAGWVGRHIATLPPASFPAGFEAYSNHVDRVLTGSGELVPAIYSVSDFNLPYDGKYSGDKNNRRALYQAMAQGLSSAPGNAGAMSGTALEIISLVDTFKSIPSYTPAVTYPNNSLAKGLKLIAKMLKSNLGARYFHTRFGGFDTHSEQDKNSYHTGRLQVLSEAIDAFYNDLTAMGEMNNTLIVVYTEFGRTVYENGSAGTDHGTITPMFVLGNSVVGGLTTPHPSMNPANLTSSKQPPMTTDFRDVWCTVLDKWLGGSVATVFPGYTHNDLGFLG